MTEQSKSPLLSLSERPRLMALVFGLRLCVLSLAFLALALLLFALGLTEGREAESLFVLYSVFQLTVSVVLIFVRLRQNLTRALMLAPVLALMFPSTSFQLLGLLVGLVLTLQGLREEAAMTGKSPWFLGTQAVLIMVLLFLLFYPHLYAIGVSSALAFLSFAAACWTWQNNIKLAMKQLD